MPEDAERTPNTSLAYAPGTRKSTPVGQSGGKAMLIVIVVVIW
jgi:hypothetical protein